MRRAQCHGVLLCNRLARCSSSVRPRLPAHTPALGRAFSVSSARNESLDEEMVRLAKYRQTSVSLKATLDTGLGLLLPQKECALGLTSRQRTLIQIASFLKRELPVRLARRVLELKSGPEGIGSMPAVIRVREWYEQSFEDIRRARVPVDLETEAEFHRLLMKIYDRHAPTLVTMARGVHELRQALTQKNLVRSASAGGEGEGVDFGELTELHTFLDKFYMSRIGIRILIGQYLELKKEEQEPGYVGLIYQHTNPAEITQQARSRGPARPWLPERTRTERTRTERTRTERTRTERTRTERTRTERAAQSAPAQSAPAQSAPAQSAPAQSAPAQSAPAQSAPAQSAPAQSAPAQSAPAQSAPAQSAPAQSAPEPEPKPWPLATSP